MMESQPYIQKQWPSGIKPNTDQEQILPHLHLAHRYTIREIIISALRVMLRTHDLHGIILWCAQIAKLEPQIVGHMFLLDKIVTNQNKLQILAPAKNKQKSYRKQPKYSEHNKAKGNIIIVAIYVSHLYYIAYKYDINSCSMAVVL